ncbi:MAG: hypothetical protein P8Y68_18170 [Anaerolineales bacterium]|jgi:hypothetical protein
MTNRAQKKSANTIYQITVQGKPKEDWRDWFNGMLINIEANSRGSTTTSFTCKIRDQAELIGIINWLHNRNMVIEKVCLVRSGSEVNDV